MKDDQFDKLLTYMQGEFATVNKRLGALEKDTATKDQFDKLFIYMTAVDTRLHHVEENMATKASIEHLVNTMDDFIKRITDNEDEQAARDAQWSRLIKWAHKVSEKTGVPLPDL